MIFACEWPGAAIPALQGFDSRPHWGTPVIIPSLVGLSMLVNVSLDMRAPLVSDSAVWPEIPTREKIVALLPLVQRATNCIVRRVKADPRYSVSSDPETINGLIVNSLAACQQPVRVMIDAHDRLFGGGSGEVFLLGPYLDVLPAAVVRQVRMPR